MNVISDPDGWKDMAANKSEFSVLIFGASLHPPSQIPKGEFSLTG